MEKSDEAFQVLGSGGKEELLAHEPHAAQAQAPESDLILQLREERFDLSALVLRTGEGGRICQVTRSLACRFMDMN